MKDLDIRRKFHSLVLQKHHRSTHSLVINELGLQHGKCRADIAIVNGKLTGYEIKSEFDTLGRLSHQVEAYNRIFDRVSIIVSEKHKNDALSLVPPWWGMVVCRKGARGGIHFDTFRNAQNNPEIEPVAVAQLLWKAEAVHLLLKCGEPGSITRMRRSFVYQRLVEIMPVIDLCREVRHILRHRTNWRDR